MAAPFTPSHLSAALGSLLLETPTILKPAARQVHLSKPVTPTRKRSSPRHLTPPVTFLRSNAIVREKPGDWLYVAPVELLDEMRPDQSHESQRKLMLREEFAPWEVLVPRFYYSRGEICRRQAKNVASALSGPSRGRTTWLRHRKHYVRHLRRCKANAKRS